METDTEIVFYDIKSAPPSRTFAPNPFKTRYALNYKGLNYRTAFVDMPDIQALREKLGVAANRTLPNGSPFYTLPVIHDHSTGKFVGDTFEIALYLDQQYPEAPKLMLPGTAGLAAAFNAHVDSLFTKHIALADDMPFPPESRSQIMRIFGERFGMETMEGVKMSDRDREAMFVSLENALGELVKAYRHSGGTTDHFWTASGTAEAQTQHQGRDEVGPFLDGTEPGYADFIVGAWLANLAESMTSQSWHRICGWHGGIWGNIHHALKPWRVIR